MKIEDSLQEVIFFIFGGKFATEFSDEWNGSRTIEKRHG